MFGFGTYASAAYAALPFVIIQASVAESLLATENISTTGSFLGNINEIGTGTDTVVSNINGLCEVTEQAIGTDTTDVISFLFLTVNESGTAVDAIVCNGNVNIAVIEGVAVIDQVTGNILWVPIPDTQNPNWTNISATGPDNWTKINTQ